MPETLFPLWSNVFVRAERKPGETLLVQGGAIRPVIHAAFPLAKVAKAHALMESGGHIGKIVLTVA